MAQPEFVPASTDDVVRDIEQLPPPDEWKPERPGELPRLRPPLGDGFGKPGPDQGYGLKLARRFTDRLQLAAGEHAADAIAGCLGVGLRRAALFGRAPVIHDFELAFSVWGFLGGAPADLVEFRKQLFREAAHHYWDQREICDAVPEATLRMRPADVRGRLASWRELLTAASHA